METYIIIIAVAAIVAVLIGSYYVGKSLAELEDNTVYVYPKTENSYLILDKCKLKCPSSGIWYEAILYQPVDDNSKLYVRESTDFFDKFVKLKDWEHGKGK